MVENSVSRRNFLKIGGITLAGIISALFFGSHKNEKIVSDSCDLERVLQTISSDKSHIRPGDIFYGLERAAYRLVDSFDNTEPQDWVRLDNEGHVAFHDPELKILDDEHFFDSYFEISSGKGRILIADAKGMQLGFYDIGKIKDEKILRDKFLKRGLGNVSYSEGKIEIMIGECIVHYKRENGRWIKTVYDMKALPIEDIPWESVVPFKKREALDSEVEQLDRIKRVWERYSKVLDGRESKSRKGISVYELTRYPCPLEKALIEAKEKNKPIFVYFTGTGGWCKPCNKLEEHVTNKEEFKDCIAENYILCKIEYPRFSSPAVRKMIDEFKERYQERGVPAMLVLDKNGVKKASIGYMGNNVETYINFLKEMKDKV